MAELFGKLYYIGQIQEVSASFIKRDFVIETDDQYPQHIKCELHQDRVDIIDSFSLGDSLKIFYNIKGRKWTDENGQDKYFVTLQAWKIEKEHVSAPVPAPQPPPPNVQNTAFAPSTSEEEEDDLPF